MLRMPRHTQGCQFTTSTLAARGVVESTCRGVRWAERCQWCCQWHCNQRRLRAWFGLKNREGRHWGSESVRHQLPGFAHRCPRLAVVFLKILPDKQLRWM